VLPPKQFSKLQSIERWGFDAELLYLAKKLRFKVVEVPVGVTWSHREGTRINPLRDESKMFLEILKILGNPIEGERDSGLKLNAIPL
jgi:hypothetical protein